MTTDFLRQRDEDSQRDHHSLPDAISKHIGALAAACQRYQVQTLWLFGSAVHGTFDPATSDLDFLVDLGDYELTVAERYGGLYMALSDLFDREIDLVTVRSPGNAAILDHITETRQVVYAA